MHGLVQFRVIEERMHHGSGEETRADRVDVDPLRCVVDRELAGEAHHRALRCAVGRLGANPTRPPIEAMLVILPREISPPVSSCRSIWAMANLHPSHTLFTFTAIVKSYCSSVLSTMVWSPANTPALLTMTSSRPTDHGYALAGEDQRDRTAVVRVDPVTTTTLSSKRFPTYVPLCSLCHVSVMVSISYACVKRCFHRSQRSENPTSTRLGE
jgi:hypothetical protein